MSNNVENTLVKTNKEKLNSLTSLSEGIAMDSQLGTQVNRTTTSYYNLRYHLVSMDRVLLNYLYAEHGIIQTLVDQPVDDSFSKGLEIYTQMLSDGDLDILNEYLSENKVISKIMQAIKWSRLFGGGGLIINTDSDFNSQFHIKTVKSKSMLDFIPVDLWELGQHGNANFNWIPGTPRDVLYNYYGHSIHESRVLRVVGKEAPSIIKPILRGWGMSEIDRLIAPLNSYFKNHNVIFELLDEAKIDIYKIENFNSSLLAPDTTYNTKQRVQLANEIKNILNALIMDKEDDYHQKQISFSGLSEIIVQIRQDIACAVRMPITKLFGVSASGFNSGEDDIENYNALIEGEVRQKNRDLIKEVIKIVCHKLFNITVDDLEIKFPSLRVLSTEQEQVVKTSEFNRALELYDRGLIDESELFRIVNKSNMFSLKINDGGIING